MPVVSALRNPLLLTTAKRCFQNGVVKGEAHRGTTLVRPRSWAMSSSVANFSAHSAAATTPMVEDLTASSSSSLTGELFHGAKDIGPDLVGQTASVQRTFGPNSNANVMLTCGGANLAKHASFDPEYSRARSYLRQHAIGPAVLSPILLQGLVGALVEAAFPQAVPVTQTMQTMQPLIVGVDVQATITVTDIYLKEHDHNGSDRPSLGYRQGKGFKVHLDTEVVRTRDNVVLAKGHQCVWIPDYLRM